VTFDAEALPGWVAPGRGARALLDGAVVAVFGELAAAELQARKLRQAVVLAEVDAQALHGAALRQPVVGELSRYQAVERDFSFVFLDAVRWAAIDGALRGLNLNELRSVVPVEIFRDAKGKAVASGSYSLLVRLAFQSGERTLTEDELTSWSEAIIAKLKELGGTQRA
jgi:phenylalanyl-tRNA synthetase beta chain